MKKVSENATTEFFEDYYEGNLVRFAKNKQTGETTINAQDAAKVMGYQDFEELLADNLTITENGIETHLQPEPEPEFANGDTLEEVADFWAEKYPQHLNEEGPDDLDSICGNNSTISNIQLTPCYTERLVDGVVQREDYYALSVWQNDEYGAVLDKRDLQRMLDFLEQYPMEK
jgi:hypothetical protein